MRAVTLGNPIFDLGLKWRTMRKEMSDDFHIFASNALLTLDDNIYNGRKDIKWTGFKLLDDKIVGLNV